MIAKHARKVKINFARIFDNFSSLVIYCLYHITNILLYRVLLLAMSVTMNNPSFMQKIIGIVSVV